MMDSIAVARLVLSPTCRTECTVKGGRAAQGLPIVYALRGP
jgi:hypothetical protein